MRMTRSSLSSAFALSAFLLSALVAGGCGSSSPEEDDDVTSADAAVGPGGFSCSDQPSTLSADVLPILMASCAGHEGCHGQLVNSAPAAYEFFVGKVADECTDGRQLAEPGHPERSYLVNKLTDTALCGDGVPMPKSGLAPGAPWQKLPDAQIQAIYDWICQGAKND
jgi:hypothetical protein